MIKSHPLNPTVKECISDSLKNKCSFAVKDKATNKLVGKDAMVFIVCSSRRDTSESVLFNCYLRTTHQIAKLTYHTGIKFRGV